MDAVIKIGGSLQEDSLALKGTCRMVESLSKRYRLLIVPGGGFFADLVRELQSGYKFSDRTAHLMAISGMDSYGAMLHELIRGTST